MHFQNSLSRAAPHLLRHFDHALQFAPLHRFRDRGSAECARDPALRAEAQIFQRHIFRRRLDSALERVFRFERWHLGAHQSEHDSLLRTLGEKTQRLEAARALVVVFQEVRIHGYPVEKDLGYRLLTPLGPPLPPRNAPPTVAPPPPPPPPRPRAPTL